MKDNIEFKDFLKLDIRLGTIVEAEKIEKSNKLIRMIIDFKDFKKQIVAGIGTKYQPSDLVDLQIPVIVNLEKKKMMGYDSEGMILAIGDNDIEALLHPDNKVESGKSIH